VSSSRAEIEAELLARVRAAAGAGEPLGPEDTESLRVAIAAAFDYGLAEIRLGEGRSGRGREDVEHDDVRIATAVASLLHGGSSTETAGLEYDLGNYHLGMIAGVAEEDAVRQLSEALDRRLLVLTRGTVTWAWFGGTSPLEPERVEEAIAAHWPVGAPLAIGAPARGLSGWRLTHNQARAAFEVAVRRAEMVHYADVALVASGLEDNLLTTSLRTIFLAPLEHERDGGEVLRETLRAYLASGGNVSATAAAMDVNRNTIATRIRTIEERTGRSVDSSSAEFEVALRLERLGEPTSLGGV
jgi:hypothetical protein